MKYYTYSNTTMEYKLYKPKFRFVKFMSLLILSVTMFLAGTVVSGHEEQVVIPGKVMALEFSEANLRAKIIELHLIHPEIVLKQAKLETGNFKSELFLQGHNLFGMKIARKRPRLQAGTYIIGTEVYARYNTWEESLLDYELWQLSQAAGLDSTEYVSFLGEHYSCDKNYTQKLSRI